MRNVNHSIMAFFNLFTSDYSVNTQEAMKSNSSSSLLVDISADGRTQNTELTAASRFSQTRSVGAVIQAQYGYKDKYLFNASLRGDGNSRFGPTYRYGLFPAVSMRWRISGEKFFQKFKWLDEFSLRASYAHSGNAPRTDYSFYNTYTTYGFSYQGEAAVYPSSMLLNNLRWETVKGANIGTNISLFGGRIRSDIDVYRNRTDDLFSNGLAIPTTTGYSNVNMNIGTMDNQGWEFALWTIPYKSKTLTIGFDFNIANNQNVFREISPYFPSSKGVMTANGNYLAMLQVGNPFGAFYGYKYKGVYADKEATIAKDANGNAIVGPNGQVVYMRFSYPTVDYIFQPGDAIYEDINHDGNIDNKDVVYLGNSNPKFTGGFGPNFTYKNWRLTSFFSFRTGVEVVNGTKMNTTKMYNYDNQSTAVLRRWRQEGDITDIPRGIIGGGYNWLGSDRYVEDASFLRFRTITLSYALIPKRAKELGIKSLRMYLTAENLYTFTNYKGQDPEVAQVSSDPFRVLTDYSMTPPAKSFTIGAVVSF